MEISSVCIIGGSGFVGRPVAEQACARGYRVRVVTRSEPRARPLRFQLPADVVAAPAILQELRSLRALHARFGYVHGGRADRGQLYGADRGEAAIRVERRPLAEVRRVRQRLPDLRRRMLEIADEDERPLVSVFLYLRPAGRARHVLFAIDHILLRPRYQRISCEI